MKHIQLHHRALDIQSCVDFIADDQAGGHNLFIGKVRSATKEKSVKRLEFEAYEPMALKEMDKILDRAIDRWSIQKIWLEHRLGILSIGEAAVVIGVSCPHRDDSFKACRFVIDELKKSVPIWKKEVFNDGEVWVAAHP